MKKISDLIKEIVRSNKINSIKDIALLLNKTEQSIRNKFSLDNFTFKEIIEILDLCNYHIEFVPNDIKQHIYMISPKEYLSEEKLNCIDTLKNKQIRKQMDTFDKFVNNIPADIKDEVLSELIAKLK